MRRLALSGVIGLVAGLLCFRYQVEFERGAGDLLWSLRLVPDLLAGRDPYGYPVSLTPSSYPLTAGLAAFPLSFLPPELAAGLFFGLSSALLAYGLTRDGHWWRLLVFLALPYWQALITVQWSPLFFAVALFPALLPLTLIKPHIGLPIALTRLTWSRAVACAVFGVLSLALLPDWPLHWLGHQAAPDQYLPPILTLPFGPLLLLALRGWRSESARFLLLFAWMPQRLWYDLLLVFLIPTSRRRLLVLVAGSWLAWLGWFFAPQLGSSWAVALVYLPALGLVLADRPAEEPGVDHSAVAVDVGVAVEPDLIGREVGGATR